MVHFNFMPKHKWMWFMADKEKLVVWKALEDFEGIGINKGDLFTTEGITEREYKRMTKGAIIDPDGKVCCRAERT